MDAINERFNEIAADLKNKGLAMTDTELGDMLGVSKSAISDIRNGRKPPSVNILRALEERCLVSIEYMNTGKGTRYALSNFKNIDKEVLSVAYLRTILYQIADVKARVLDRDVNDVLAEVGRDNIEAVQRIIVEASKV